MQRRPDVPYTLPVTRSAAVRLAMSDQAELAFVKNFTNILASQPVTFDNDFQEEPEKTLKRVPVLQVCANRFPPWTMCNWAVTSR